MRPKQRREPFPSEWKRLSDPGSLPIGRELPSHPAVKTRRDLLGQRASNPAVSSGTARPMISLAIGIGAGLVSALLFGVVITGSPLSMMLSVIAPLPIFIAALGWNHRS